MNASARKKTETEPEPLDMKALLRYLHLAEPAETTSLFRVAPDAFLIGGAILALAREVRVAHERIDSLRKEGQFTRESIDGVAVVLERSIRLLAEATGT